MGESLKAREAREVLRHARADVKREAIPKEAWDRAPKDARNVFVFFNLEAAWNEGHAVLGLGPVGGAIETYSYYRHSSKVEAPGLMACLEEPVPFRRIRERDGWIVHGQPGDFWNEHMNAAIALWCEADQYEAVRSYAERKKAHRGTYNLITYNCLTFVEEALASGGIRFLTEDRRPLHTFIPKDAFRSIRGVEGAHRYREWKYWFPVTDPPRNGLRSIADAPGSDKPLA